MSCDYCLNGYIWSTVEEHGYRVDVRDLCPRCHGTTSREDGAGRGTPPAPVGPPLTGLSEGQARGVQSRAESTNATSHGSPLAESEPFDLRWEAAYRASEDGLRREEKV